MSQRTTTARAARGAANRLGELVILAGAVEVRGIFYPRGKPAGSPMGSEVGLGMRISQQRNPMVDLLDEDAAGLADGDQISIAGADYLITRLDPDGLGMTEVQLMPAPAVTDPAARWK